MPSLYVNLRGAVSDEEGWSIAESLKSTRLFIEKANPMTSTAQSMPAVDTTTPSSAEVRDVSTECR
jgi:hypothetical protein